MLGTPVERTTQAVIYFRTGDAKNASYMRLVVREGEELQIEVAGKDRLGKPSWRIAAGNSSEKVAHVLALAVLKSQMTPLQRIEKPHALHPDGIVWNAGEVEITLGTVKL